MVMIYTACDGEQKQIFLVKFYVWTMDVYGVNKNAFQ